MSASDFYNDGEFKDYYLILQIDRSAEPEVISFAYKALAKKNHPDVGGAIEKMKLLNEAYDVLNDTISKNEYDQIYDSEKETKQKIEETQTTYYEEPKTNYYYQNETYKYKETKYQEQDEYEYLKKCTPNDLREKLVNENLSDNIFEVLVRGYKFILPNACVCCLEKPDSQLKVKYIFNEKNIFANTYKAIIIFFPICRACKKHVREFSIKTFLFIVAALLPGCLMVLWLINKKPNIDWAALLIEGSVISIISTLLISKLIKMSELEDIHANRGPAVEILKCDEMGTKFWFYNWLYADQFAEDNDSEVVPIIEKKCGRSCSLLKGKLGLQTIVVVLLIMVSIITIIYPIKDMWKSSQKAEHPLLNNMPDNIDNFIHSLFKD